jgi:hypothetical protein
MQAPIFAETSLRESSPLPTEKYAPRYKEVLRRDGARALLHHVRTRLRDGLCIWFFAFRSFRGHIRTQSAKGRAMVHFGPAFESLSNRSCQRNVRTIFRTLYTKKLLATLLPWADTQDLEIFLMGFDAGEHWEIRRRAEGITAGIQSGSHQDSWLTPEHNEAIWSELRRIIEAGSNQGPKPDAERTSHTTSLQS